MLRHQPVLHLLRVLHRREEGATAAEYGLLAAFITLVIVAGVGAFGTSLDSFYATITTALADLLGVG